MEISKVRGIVGLSGHGKGTRHGVSWHPVLGVPAVARNYPAADILYTVELYGWSDENVPLLNLGTGAIVANGAVVSRTAATDFEGSSLLPLVQLYGIVLERPVLSTGAIVVRRQSDSLPLWCVGPYNEVVAAFGAGPTLGMEIGASTTLGFVSNFSSFVPPYIRVTVLGSSV